VVPPMAVSHSPSQMPLLPSCILVYRDLHNSGGRGGCGVAKSELMFLSGQPALKLRLATSSKRDGNEWAWVVNAAPTATAVWAERTCKVAML